MVCVMGPPTVTFPKLRLVGTSGKSCKFPDTPVPLRGMAAGELGADADPQV